MSEQENNIVFHDAFIPGIGSGAYRLVLQQSVTAGDKKEDQRHYYHEQRFVVRGPRYTVDAADIHSRFPPAGATGKFDSSLPQIALNKRALPWERSPWAGAGSGTPWLALLILSQKEYLEAGGDACIKNIAIDELEDTNHKAREDASILWPKLTAEDGGKGQDAQAQVIDIPLSMFSEIAPKRADLALLAHLRHVQTTKKAEFKMHADGEFAVVVANRLPQTGGNRALLVSVEGWQQYLPDDRNEYKDSKQKVRLVLLDTWSFIVDPNQDCTAGYLLNNLQRAPFGVDFVDAAPEGDVRQILQQGYVPLEYRSRDGVPPFAWYRGALSPVRVAAPSQPAPRPSHLAAAEQLGRLLALSSAEFAGAWRRFFDSSFVLPTEIKDGDKAKRLVDYHRLHIYQLKRDLEAKAKSKPGEPPETIAVAGMIDWLARLLLLYPVPFGYLAGDERLLPRESIRFFHIDTNWLEALADGAMSIGARSEDDIKRDARRRALSEIVSQYLHYKINGEYSEDVGEKNETPWLWTEQITGFVMRSEVVSGWPGLEAEISGGEVLRLDRLGEDVMFCLVRGKFSAATFKEPPEGMEFVVDPKSKEYKVVQRGGERSHVLEIAQTKLSSDEPISRSAQLAMCMVQTGKTLTIKWQDEPK